MSRIGFVFLTCALLTGMMAAVPAGAIGTTTSISGTVTAAVGGDLAGICVGASLNGTVSTIGVTTAADGTYTISGLAPGSYGVVFQPGCGSGDYVTQWYNGTASGTQSAPGTLVAVTVASPATGINAVMSVATSISGTVTAAVGGDLAGICVNAYPVGGANSTGGVSAANGTYTVEGLLPGSYYVDFFAGPCGGNYIPQWYNGTAAGASLESGALAVAVTGASPATGINAAMAPGTSISGTVTAAVGGALLAGVCVEVFSSGGSFASGTTTAANGTYTITGLAVGSYDIQFDAAECGAGNYVSQWYNGTAAGASSESGALAVTASPPTGINAAMAPGASISGTVTAAVGGALLAGVCVTASSSGGSFGSADTAADGTYTITGLAAGSYDITFDATDCGAGNYVTDYYNGTPAGTLQYSDAVAVPVTAGGTASAIGAALATGSSISGTVTAAAGGAALAGVCVSASSLDGLAYSYAISASNGTYTLAGLAPDSYTVQFYSGCEDGNFAEQYYNNTSTGTPLKSGSSAVAVTVASPRTGLNAVMAAGATISGTVTAAANGAGLADVCVSATSTDTGDTETATTAADGTYTIDTLPGDTYSIEADPTCQGSVTSSYAIVLSSTPLTITAGSAMSNENFALVAAASGGGGGGGGGSPTGPTNAPPPSGLPTSDYGTPISGTASSTTATTITLSSGGASVTVTVPAGALPAGTTVSIYPITDTSTLTADVPAGQSYVLAFAVSWETPGGTAPTASTPVTMTITDPSIKAGDKIYALTSTGLVAVGTATVDGSATVTFSSDPVFVVAETTVALALPARPSALTVAFHAKSYALSAGAKKTLRALSKKLLPGASVTFTGYANANETLARDRAEAVAYYLAPRIHIHVKLVFVTHTTTNKATVTTTRQ